MRRHNHTSYLWLTLSVLSQTINAHSQCVIDPSSIVLDACTSYADLETLNQGVAAPLHDLTQNTDFFAYYRLNLFNKVCPFWNDEGSLCGNRACAVETIEDERDIPLVWRAEELSKLEGARAEHPGRALQKRRPKQRPLDKQLGEDVDESCVLEDDDECDERDYCMPEDEGAASKGDYVSLVNNTERFTGYSGPGARQVWDAIYRENCFAPTTAQPHLADGRGGLQAAKELRTVFQEYSRQRVDTGDDLYPLNDECLEQRAFYRIISGMHASISTHICWDYFNQSTGEWVRNLECYKERLHNHPERISNLYFNYALVSRAIAKIRKHLQSYTFCSGDADQDRVTKQKTLALADLIRAAPQSFDESLMFRDPDMLDLKDDFKHRFRNVSRMMDCVGCDKCRLWGKVQTAGYGAALKILFEFDETKNGENPHLRRTELVALINTFGRLSHSLHSVGKFRQALSRGDLKYLDADIAEPPESEQEAKPRSGAQQEQHLYNTARENAGHDNTLKGVGGNGMEADQEEHNVGKVSHPKKRDEHADPSLSEMFQTEFALVWRVYKMVLWSWVQLPFKISAILISELRRYWTIMTGGPDTGRTWRLHFPAKDEL